MQAAYVLQFLLNVIFIGWLWWHTHSGAHHTHQHYKYGKENL